MEASTALAVYDNNLAVLSCCVCGRKPRDTPWGAWRVTFAPDGKTEVARVPSGDGCMECREAVVDAMHPQKVSWSIVAEECKGNPQKKKSYNEYRLRRAGKFCRMPRSTVQRTTRIGCRWEEEAVAVRRQDLEARYPNISMATLPIRFEKVTNARGELEEVVLCEDAAAQPKVILFAEVVAEVEEHRLMGQQQLRSAQGSDLWRELREETLRSRPSGASVTRDDLNLMLNRGASARQGPQSKPRHPLFDAPPGDATEEKVTTVTVEEEANLSQGGCDGDDLHEVSIAPSDSASGVAGSAVSPAELGPGKTPTKAKRMSGSDVDGSRSEGDKKRSRISAKKDRAETIQTVTILSFLAGTVKEPKVAIYRDRQRQPGLLRGQDEFTQKQINDAHQALIAAERMAPTEIALLSDLDLQACVGMVLQFHPISDWPDITLEKLVHRRCAEKLNDPKTLFEICWPFNRSGDNDEYFDPARATIASMPRRIRKVRLAADKAEALVLLCCGRTGRRQIAPRTAGECASQMLGRQCCFACRVGKVAALFRLPFGLHASQKTDEVELWSKFGCSVVEPWSLVELRSTIGRALMVESLFCTILWLSLVGLWSKVGLAALPLTLMSNRVEVWSG